MNPYKRVYKAIVSEDGKQDCDAFLDVLYLTAKDIASALNESQGIANDTWPGAHVYISAIERTEIELSN